MPWDLSAGKRLLISLYRVRQLVVKEFIQFRRDWLLTFFLLLVPMFQLLLMAHATGREIRNVKVAVLDWDHSPTSRRLVQILDETSELSIRFHLSDEGKMQRLLEEGKITAAVLIPAGFEGEMLSPHGTPRIQVIADGENIVTASAALRGTQAAVDALFRDVAGKGEGDFEAHSYLDFRPRILFNPTYNIRHFTVPAQVGFIIYQITLAVASLGIARERELGTLEQLMVTPLSRLELTLGKAIPAFIVGGVNFAILLVVARVGFGVPLKGSLLLLSVLTLLFLAAEVGWGITISTFSSTQQQAILFVFLQAMVDVAFSGFLVPVKNMPLVLRFIAQFVPLQHYLAILREIMLKGAVLTDLWPRVGALLLLGLATLTAAVLNTNRRLD